MFVFCCAFLFVCFWGVLVKEGKAKKHIHPTFPHHHLSHPPAFLFQSLYLNPHLAYSVCLPQLESGLYESRDLLVFFTIVFPFLAQCLPCIWVVAVQLISISHKLLSKGHYCHLPTATSLFTNDLHLLHLPWRSSR